MPPILTVTDLEKFYGSRRVFEGVSFAVEPGDRIALVGVNGSGKSTLLRVVALHGVTEDPTDQADHGEIRRGRGVEIGYVPQEPRLDPERTVAETLEEGQAAHRATRDRLDALEHVLPTLSGAALDDAIEEQALLIERVRRLGGWDVTHERDAIREELELPPLDAKIGALSGGERRRVAIARAMLGHPDLLVLDEPTNHLDTAAIRWLEGWLVARAEALLLITHDRYFLDRVATRILELDRGKLYAYEGNYSRFLELQADRLQVESDQEDRRAAFVRRELDWIRRGPAAQMKKQQARVDRFEAAVTAAPTREDRAPSERQMRFVLPPGPKLSRNVLEVQGVGRKHGDRWLFKDLDFTVERGERIGIVGPNGAGKSTLLRVLLGQLPPDRGVVRIGGHTRFAFLDQGREDLDDTKTVIDEVADGNDRVELPEGQVVHVRTFLRWLLFDDRTADTRIGRLSGGERNRVLLARLLRRGGNVIVLDEPTNDLDLQTLSVLEEALVEFPGCALVVSHDRWFLDKVATHLLVFEGDGRVVKHAGNYSDWERRTGGEAALRRAKAGEKGGEKAAGKAGTAGEKPADAAAGAGTGGAGGAVAGAAGATGGAAGEAKRKLSFKEKRELDGMEEAILDAEGRLEALQAKLADPATYKAGDDVRGLAVEAEGLRVEVERLYARWAELEARA